MDDDKAYRLSTILFEKIALQRYCTIDELYSLLDEAEEKCFPTGHTHRLLYHYRVAVNRLKDGVYYVDVVDELSLVLFN